MDEITYMLFVNIQTATYVKEVRVDVLWDWWTYALHIVHGHGTGWSAGDMNCDIRAWYYLWHNLCEVFFFFICYVIFNGTCCGKHVIPEFRIFAS